MIMFIMNRCVYSSFIFLLNSTFCSLCNEHYYSFIFKMLFFTSILYHSTPSTILYYIDQVSVVQVVLYGLYKVIQKTHSFNFILLGIVLSFITTIILYVYGYIFKCFCFDPVDSEYYHSLLHYIGFIGHSLILIL
jgi:hypothetical protein